ncbi:hypothetical protein ACTQ34_16585, partial [Agathobaculum sp. LCP25S3_E8]|uniref:hypothetical protein n=1 Tax=Agathobaculum sp. LCP25S3_E8 TaxID=3438735 RepID=UPI003F92642D
AAVFLRSATLHFGKLRCITMLFRFWVFPDCTFLDISTGYGQAVLQAHGQFMEYPRKIDIETAQRKIISGTQHICQEVERNE